jgi:DNA repair photolyase
MSKTQNKYHLLQPRYAVTELDRPHPVFLYRLCVNPYTNCVYGCQYCYSVKDEEIPGSYSPQIGVKTNIAYALKKYLANMNMTVPSAIGTLTDPYQPAEKDLLITRRCLELITEKHSPLQIFTKSDLVLRDADLLGDYSRKGFCTVLVTLFTMDRTISGKLEPHAPGIEQRLSLISQLRRKNIICGVLLMPIMPYVNDGPGQLEEVFAAARRHGAEYVIPGGAILRPDNSKERIMKLLDADFNKISHRYEALYDKDTMLPFTYSSRIMEQLRVLSEKYKLPLNLPVENASSAENLRIEPL